MTRHIEIKMWFKIEKYLGIFYVIFCKEIILLVWDRLIKEFVNKIIEKCSSTHLIHQQTLRVAEPPPLNIKSASLGGFAKCLLS